MGKKWGELAEVRRVVQFRLSPYEQNIWAGAFSKGIPNLFRRIRSQFFIVVPPFVLGYLIYDWCNKDYERRQRKNPADYANDE